MGVYIKSMEMPKCCDSCDFYDIILGEKPFCALTTKSGGIAFNPCKEKMKDCPLVEVKTPHGRLKDVDKILNGEGRYVISFGKDGIDTEEINRATTIIEAEAKT